MPTYQQRHNVIYGMLYIKVKHIKKINTKRIFKMCAQNMQKINAQSMLNINAKKTGRK